MNLGVSGKNLGKISVYFSFLLFIGVLRNFVPGGGVQPVQLRTEGRENRDLGAVTP
jgi:hypothetical protein